MLAGALAAAAPAAVPQQLEALRWSAPGTEMAALTTQPAVCLSDDPRLPLPVPLPVEVQAGHALFNSPMLLGGQAAKAGLSCASCHANGRDNPHFLMAGVSGVPGTADVTTSFFSAARSNGRFDPVAIPDLALPGKVSRDPAAGALEPFIRTLIVDEFAGAEPGPATLGALAAYVRAVRVCPGAASQVQPRTIDDQLHLVRHALAGASAMAARGEAGAADALLSAARHQLGLVAERFAGAELARERALLLSESRALQGLASDVTVPTAFTAKADKWTARYEARLVPRLRRKAGRSLYHPATLGFVAPQRDNR